MLFLSLLLNPILGVLVTFFNKDRGVPSSITKSAALITPIVFFCIYPAYILDAVDYLVSTLIYPFDFSDISCDAYRGWGFYFQDSASPQMGSIALAGKGLFLHILYLQLVKCKDIFGYSWAVLELFSDYLRILKDKCAPGLEWTLHNPPKPHAFTSLALQSSQGSSGNNGEQSNKESSENNGEQSNQESSGNNGEGSSNPNPIVPDQGPNTLGMTPMEAYTANLNYTRSAIREQYPGLPEIFVDIFARRSLREVTVREFARRWRNINNHIILISIPSVFEIPYIGLFLRSIFYSIISYFDATLLPSVISTLETILATYKIYRLPSRIIRIYFLIVKIHNYVIKSKIICFGILIYVVFVTSLLSTPEIHCDASRAWEQYIEYPSCSKLQWGIKYIWVIILLLIGIVLLSYPFHKKLVWAKQMERKRQEEKNKCTHNLVYRRNLTGDIGSGKHIFSSSLWRDILILNFFQFLYFFNKKKRLRQKTLIF